MNTLSFDSKRCERIRQQLDSYLSNELLVETTSEVVRHLESCEACSRDLESRMRVRDVLQRAVANRPMPESMRANILRTLRDSQRRSLSRVVLKHWALGLAAAAGRITTELVLVLLLGARAEVYLFPAAVLVPNLLAGFLSGFVTIFVLRAFARSDAEVNEDRDAQAGTRPEETAETASRQFPAGPAQSGASAYCVRQK